MINANIWTPVETNICRGCEYDYPHARYIEIDAQGRCENCATRMCEECGVEWMHVESENRSCSACELAGAQCSDDAEQVAYWRARHDVDITFAGRRQQQEKASDIFGDIVAAYGFDKRAQEVA